MRLFVLIFVGLTLGRCDKLDRTYLPPPGSNFSGGSPGSILGPLDTPLSTPISQSFDYQSSRTEPAFNQQRFRPQDGNGNIPQQSIGDLAVQSELPQTFIPHSPFNPAVQSSVNNLQNNFNIPTTTTSYAFTQTTTHPLIFDFVSSTTPSFGLIGTNLNTQPLISQQPFLNNQYLPSQEIIQNGHTDNKERPYFQNQQPNIIDTPQKNVVNPEYHSQISGLQLDLNGNQQRPLQYSEQIAGQNKVSSSFPSQFPGSLTNSPQNSFDSYQAPATSNDPNNRFTFMTPGFSDSNIPLSTTPDLYSRNQYQGNNQLLSNSLAPQIQPQDDIKNNFNRPIFLHNQNSSKINIEVSPANENTNNNIDFNRRPQGYQTENINLEDFSQKPVSSVNFATSTASSLTPEIESISNPSQIDIQNKNILLGNKPERIQTEDDRHAVLLNYENTITPDGDFAYSFDTSNGIHADESGTAKDGVKAQGAFSYIGDDGKNYSIVYTADENGYQPRGDHLPTPPPIPKAILKVIEQANKDKEAGIIHDGSYDEDKYGYKNYERPINKYKAQKNHNLDHNKPKISLKTENRFRDFSGEQNHKMEENSFDNNKQSNKNENNEKLHRVEPTQDILDTVNVDVKTEVETKRPLNRQSKNNYDGNVEMSQTNSGLRQLLKSETQKGQFNNNYQRPSIAYKGFDNQYLPEETNLGLIKDTHHDVMNTQYVRKTFKPLLIDNTISDKEITDDNGNDKTYSMNQNIRDRKPLVNQHYQALSNNHTPTTQKSTLTDTEEETGYDYLPPQQPFNQENNGFYREGSGSLKHIQSGNQNLKPFMTPNVLYNKERSNDEIQPIHVLRVVKPVQNLVSRQRVTSKPATTSHYQPIQENSQKNNLDYYENTEATQKSYDTDSTPGSYFEPNIYKNQRVSTTPKHSFTRNQLVSSTTPMSPQKPSIYGSTKSQPIQIIQDNSRDPYSTIKPSEIDSTLSPNYATDQNIISQTRPIISPTGYNRQPQTKSRINLGPIEQESGTLENIPSTTYRPNYSVNDITTAEGDRDRFEDTTPIYVSENFKSPVQDGKVTPFVTSPIESDDGYDYSTMKPFQRGQYTQSVYPHGDRLVTPQETTFIPYPTTERVMFPTTERPHHQENPTTNFVRQPEVQGPKINLGPFQGPEQISEPDNRIGEDFRGPIQPQYFDPQTGYHY